MVAIPVRVNRNPGQDDPEPCFSGPIGDLSADAGMEQMTGHILRLALAAIPPLVPAFLIVRKVESWEFQIALERRWPGQNAWPTARLWGWTLAIAVYVAGVVWLAARML